MICKTNKITKLFYRYLISYIFLFLIPLVLFGSAFYISSFKVFKNEVEDYSKSKLYQTMGFLDEQLKNLERIAINISFNKNLYPYVIEDNSYWENGDFIELKTYLSNNVINNEIIDEIILCLNNKDFVFTSRGKVSIETLFENMVKINVKDAGLFMENIEHLEVPQMIRIPKRDKDSSLLVQETYNVFQDNENSYTFYAYPAYMYPVPQVKGDTYGTVVFKINCSKLNDIMRATLGDMVGEVHIFTDGFKELSSIESDKFLSSSNIINLLKDNSNKKISYYEGKNGKQICSTTCIENKISLIDFKSKLTDYHYVAVLNVTDYFIKVTKIQQKVLILIITVVLTGIIMSTVLAYKNYRPIWSLMKLTGSIKHNKKNNSNNNNDNDNDNVYYFKNEFDEIETSINDMFKENMMLSDKVSLQQPYVEDQIISMLLKGSLNNKNKIIDILDLCNIEFTNKYFIVLVLSICNNSESVNDVTFSELSYCMSKTRFLWKLLYFRDGKRKYSSNTEFRI